MLMKGILISTIIQAYTVSVLLRGILTSTIIQAVLYERAYERDSHKHDHIYKQYMSVRAYERDSHKHDHTSCNKQYMSVLMRGILISTIIYTSSI